MIVQHALELASVVETAALDACFDPPEIAGPGFLNLRLLLLENAIFHRLPRLAWGIMQMTHQLSAVLKQERCTLPRR